MGRPPCGEVDERRWRERFERYRASGLGVQTFCLAEGVSRSSFYRWKRRLSEVRASAARPEGTPKRERMPAPTQNPAESVFVPVSVKAGPIEVELPNGAVVRLSSEISGTVLTEVIRAVGAIRPPTDQKSC
jgi:transposase-like protein